MSTFDENFQKALAAAAPERKKPVPKVLVKVQLKKAYGGSRDESHFVDVTVGYKTFHSRFMDQRDAAECVPAIKAWFRYVKALPTDLEAIQTVKIISKGLYLDINPGSQLFPHPALVEGGGKELAGRKFFANAALAVRQGTSTPRWGIELPLI